MFNAYTTLNGTNEFLKNNKKKYPIYIVNNDSVEEYMSNIFTEFLNNQNNNNNEKHYLGIDFEFNKISKLTRDVALMQLNLENSSNIGYIFLLYPPSLKAKTLKSLLDLLTNTAIIKILHGSESLDIPYLFNQLLVTEHNITNFSKNFYDTRLMCDFSNNLKKSIDKCSIYELLLNKKIISKSKLKQLDENEEKMGPIYLINIDINNMSPELINYCLYDVIYLPELYKHLIKKNKEYYKAIVEIFFIVNSYKRNINENFKNMILLVNSLNTYYYFKNKGKISLHLKYENIIEELMNKSSLKHLYNINYLKIFFKVIVKYILYEHILSNFIVYKKSNVKYNYNEKYYEQYYNIFKNHKYINIIIKKIKKMIKQSLL